MKIIEIRTQAELDALQRLLSKTEVNNDFGCWDFKGSKDKCGYGKLSFGVEKSAHRISFLLFNGKIKKGMDISHDCDNPSCVNPSHLKSLTRSQNIKGSVIRGRIKVGLESPYSKITKTQLKEMLRLRSGGWSYSAIGKKFKISGEAARRNLLRTNGQYGSNALAEFVKN